MKRLALVLLLLSGCSGGTLRLSAPLTIVALAPGPGSTAAPSVTPLVTFSDPVEASALAAIHLEGPGGAVTAPASLSMDGRTATLAPAAPLVSGGYVLTVGAEVRRSSDRARLGTDVVSHFTVQVVQPPSFSLVALFPTAGSRDADPSGPVRAVFSAPLDCTSALADANADGLLDGLEVRANGNPVCTTIAEVSCKDSTLVCQPASPFAAGATVDASLPASLRGADGAVLGTPVSWSFEVIGDAARPLYVISAEPAGESVGVPRETLVTVGFNLPLDEDRLQQAATAGFPDYFVVSDAGTGMPIAGSLSSAPAGAGESVTFTPTTPFGSGATISVSIGTGLRAAAASGGASLAAPYSFRFRVADAAQYAVILSPADGSQGVVPSSELLAVFTRPPDPATVVTTGAGATVTLVETGGQDAGPLTCRAGASELRCTGPAALTLNSSYTFTVRGGPTGVRALGGEALPADASSTFQVGLTGSLLGVDPPDGDRNVLLAEAGAPRPVCAIFSEDLDPASVDASTLTIDVLVAGKPVRTLSSGAPTLSAFPLPGTNATKNRVCMVPLPLRQACGQVPQDLPYAGTVAVHLHPARTTLGQDTPAFDWSFSTEPAPTIASVSAANDVVSIAALDGAVDVPVNAVLRVLLSEPAALPAAGVTLSTGGALAAVTASVAADGALLITPSAALSFGKVYTLALPTGLTTARGAPVGGGLTLSFTTSPATTALIQPSKNQSVAETGVAAVVFSRPILQASVDATTLTVVSGSQSLPALFGFHPDSPPRSVAVIPVPTWLSGQSVTLDVTTAVRDFRGNPLSAEVTRTFNVEANPATRRPQSIDSNNLKPKPNSSIDITGVAVNLPGGNQQRNHFLPNSANSTSVTLAATGNGGCAAGPVPIDVLFDVAAGGFSAVPKSSPRSGCEYLLTVKQSLLSNLLLESIGPSSDVTGLYTGETTAPMVNQLLVDGQSPQATVSGWPLFEIDASERLDPATFAGALLAADTDTCVPGGGDTSGCIAVDVTTTGSALFVKPRAPLAAGTTCTLRLGAPLADLAGNALTSFADRAFTVDSTVPHVVSTVPIANATGVAGNAAVQVTFSEPILASSATPTRPGAAGSVTLDTGAGAAPICASVTGTKLVLDSDVPLTAGATYALHLAGVTDLAGNVCPDTDPLSFTVAP